VSTESKICHHTKLAIGGRHELHWFCFINISTMADRSRSRSRSPDRGAPPASDPPADQNGDGAPPPADSAPAAAPTENPNGSTGDEVKLYVGNLDYGA